MTRSSRGRHGTIALATLVTLAAAGCADDSNANPTDGSSTNDATLTGLVFNMHRDPG